MQTAGRLFERALRRIEPALPKRLSGRARWRRRDLLVATALSAALSAAAMALAGCGGGGDSGGGGTEPGAERNGEAGQGATGAQGRGRADAGELARSERGAKVSTVATNLEVPWGIAFLPDGRALVTERPGRVRLLSTEHELKAEPVAQIPVRSVGEGGLLGIAIDPRFERNRFVYLYRTTEAGNVVTRYRFAGGELKEQANVVEGIQAAAIHDGGRIRFGPDDRLYVTTGDAGQAPLAQIPDSLNGKLLSLGPEDYRGDAGGRPEIVSLGHRNPQGLDWHPGSGRLYSDEHGPECCDEVNLIREGRNYGWPQAVGEGHGEFASPLIVYQEPIAPSGASFVSLPGSRWSGDFLVAALRGQQIRRLRFDGRRIALDEALFVERFGRLRTVVEGPDGALYALTSNRDGRGTPIPPDDRILRIVPPAR